MYPTNPEGSHSYRIGWRLPNLMPRVGRILGEILSLGLLLDFHGYIFLYRYTDTHIHAWVCKRVLSGVNKGCL